MQRIKYTDSDGWDELKKKYRTALYSKKLEC